MLDQQEEQQSQVKSFFSRAFQTVQAQSAKTNDAIVAIDPTSEKAADNLAIAIEELSKLTVLVKSNDGVFKAMTSPAFNENYKKFNDMACKCDDSFFTTFADPKDITSLETSYKGPISNLRKTIAKNQSDINKAKKEIKKAQKGAVAKAKAPEPKQAEAVEDSETDSASAA